MEDMQTTPAVVTTTPQPGHYDIDPGRSRVTFRTRHLFGLAPVRGSFAIRSGVADVADPIDGVSHLRRDRRRELPHQATRARSQRAVTHDSWTPPGTRLLIFRSGPESSPSARS